MGVGLDSRLVGMLVILFLVVPGLGQKNPYLWTENYDSSSAIQNRIPVPEGYVRVATNKCSFGDWLRNLPLKKGRPPVYLYNGKKKTNQDVHFAVVDLDIGDEDLQQCADVIIRLRAEYLYHRGLLDSIKFHLTNGDLIRFRRWISGYRPRVRGNAVSWIKKTGPDSSYKTFGDYLRFIFRYAGTYSLSKELKKVETLSEIRIGDVFIQGGFPGHAVLVVDMAVDPKTKKKIFLLAQSFMPAQDLHILRNLNDSELNPWYEVGAGDKLETPEWTFEWGRLRRYAD